MPNKKRRGGRRGFRIGKYVNLAFKLLGLGVAASPAIAAFRQHGSNIENGFNQTVFNYTGYAPADGGWSQEQAVKGIGTLIGAVVVAKIGSMLARRF